MARTYRKILSRGKDYENNLFMDEVDDSAAKHRKIDYNRPHKLKPYTKSFKFKEKAEDRKWDRERTPKLSRDRINRSFKKGVRQQLKKELKEELDDL